MNLKKFAFSTPLVNPERPFGLKNPCVIITDQSAWQVRGFLEEDSDLNRWARKQKLGELEPNIYQAVSVIDPHFANFS